MSNRLMTSIPSRQKNKNTFIYFAMDWRISLEFVEVCFKENCMVRVHSLKYSKDVQQNTNTSALIVHKINMHAFPIH